MRLPFLPVTAACVLAAAPALAQESGRGATGWTVGLIGVGSPSIYTGADTDLRALPGVTYRGEGFSIGVRGLAFTLSGDDATGIDLIVTPRFAPYDPEDSALLVGMDRGFTADAGLAFRAGLGPATRFDGRIVQEITGEHDGQEIDLRLSRALREIGLPVEVFGGVTWQSAELSGFLYGVRPGEAIVGRPAYAPGQTLSPYIGLGTRIPVSDAVSVLGSVRARFLDDAITASPIVDEDLDLSATIGISFDF